MSLKYYDLLVSEILDTFPDATFKPLLNVGDAFTVNNRFEFAPIVVSRAIDTDPPETLVPLSVLPHTYNIYILYAWDGT